jgi:hypothetical protein
MGAAAALLAYGAQAATAPTTYTLVETNNLVGSQSVVYARDGDKAISEQTGAPALGFPNGLHTKAFYDLKTGTSWTLDLRDASTPCGPSHFTSDWGDPFVISAGLTAQAADFHPTGAGPESVNGIATQKSVAMTKDGKMELWVEPKTGLLVKWVTTAPGKAPETVIEVKSLSFTAPPASAFALPPKCKAG